MYQIRYLNKSIGYVSILDIEDLILWLQENQLNLAEFTIVFNTQINMSLICSFEKITNLIYKQINGGL